MPIARLRTPRWIGADCHEHSEVSPEWPTVEAAIRRLDQASWQEVFLNPTESDESIWLSVSGGQGNYLVTGSAGDEWFPTYAKGQDNGAKALVTVGGQAGEYPTNWLVSIEEALAVARSFYEAGGFQCGVRWSAA
jgi:putative intracellular protease/amidase